MAVYSISDRFTPNVLAEGSQAINCTSTTLGLAKGEIGKRSNHVHAADGQYSEETAIAKLNFLTHFSKELRTPLAQISGPLERLQNADSSLSETERKRLYGMIGLYTSRLLDLVDQLLDTRPGQSAPVPAEPTGSLPLQACSERPPRETLLTPTGRRCSSYDDELLQRLMAIMEENLEETDFNVHKMCGMVHLSHMHFIRKVKQLTGKKPIDLLKSFRLKRAKDLLRQNNMTVAEIAYKVGYDMPNSFSRAFKKEFGISPTEYLGVG